MPSLGNAILTLRVKGDEFKAGLANAKGQAEKTAKGIGSAFGRAQKSVQAAAGKVPVFGGALASLASPMGLASAGIGLIVGGLTKMVGKTLDVGRRLGELREKLGVSAESIQIYERAIEEGNGKTGAFEKTTLRLQKSIGDAAGGNKAAAAEFDKLGLSFEDLANKSPEEALRAVLGAANDTLGPTDRASVLAKTLGRSYADLGGFATKGADDLTAMLDGVKDVAVTMSGEGVTAVDQYDTANRNMRDSFGSIVTEVGMALIPVLTQLFGVIQQLMPIIKVIIAVGLLPLQLAVTRVSAAVNIISALLRGDFTGALNHAKNFFIDTATSILKVGAKIVGLFNKDMAASINGVVADLDSLKVEAEEETEPALAILGEAATTTAEDFDTLTEAETAAGVAATVLTETLKTESDKIVQDSADRTEKLLADYAKEITAMAERAEAEKQDRIARADANKTFRDAELEANKTAWGITDVEYSLAQASLKTLSSDKYADLIEQAEEFGIDDLALLAAHNRKVAADVLLAGNKRNGIIKTANELLAQDVDQKFKDIAQSIIDSMAAGTLAVDQASTDITTLLESIPDEKVITIRTSDSGNGGSGGGQGVPGGSSKARPAPGPTTLDPTKGDIVDAYPKALLPQHGFFKTTTSGRYYHNLLEFPSRRSDVAAWLAAGGVPSAAQGAFVKGSQQGSLVRVGENFTDENITPVGGRGGSGGGGMRQPIIIRNIIGNRTLADVWVEGESQAERQGRTP